MSIKIICLNEDNCTHEWEAVCDANGNPVNSVLKSGTDRIGNILVCSKCGEATNSCPEITGLCKGETI